MVVEYASLDIIKGYTKASVIMWVLMALTEFNPKTDFEKLEAFVPFLEKSWLLPLNAPWSGGVVKGLLA